MRIDLKHTVIFLRSDDLVQMNCSDHDYSVTDLIDISIAQGKITNGQRKLLLVIVEEFTNIESEAREFMATDESTQYSLAEAYVIKSLGQKILANFYLKINKPKVPSMFFNNVANAETWLKSIKKT